MASWTWLLAAVLLSLLSVSVARPRLTATKEEEATLGPEGKQRGRGMQCLAGGGLARYVPSVLSSWLFFVEEVPPQCVVTRRIGNFDISCSRI